MIKAKLSNNLQNIAYSAMILVIVVYALSALQEIIIPFLFAGILSFLLMPICSKLEKFGIPRALSIVTSILLLITLLSIVIYLIVNQILALENLLPLLITKGTNWINFGEKYLRQNFHINQSQALAEGQKYLTELLKNTPKILGSVFNSTSSFLINFALLPLYIFLFLSYRDFLKRFVVKLFHSTGNQKIYLVIKKINDVMQNYVVGLLLVILIIGILNTTALLILGIQNALFFGFFAAFLVLIPYVGIAIGAALPIFVAFITKDSYLYPLGVAASFAVIQFLEGNFVTPYIVGSKVSVNSLASIIALLLFGTLWGITGLVLAIPLTAVLKVLFEANDYLKPWGYLLGDDTDNE